MYIAYIDDSGNPDLKADKRLFVLSSVLIHEKDLTMIKGIVNDYKKNNFEGKYLEAEIHTHDIYKSVEDFYGITDAKRISLLDNLYEMIGNLPIKIISSVINKQEIKSMKYDVSQNGWIHLVERIDGFLDKDVNPNKGMLRIDESCRITDSRIMKIVNTLRKKGSNFQTINHIVEEPIFFKSKDRKGIQLADAVAYCTQRHLNNLPDFEKYWKIIEKKLRTDSKGNYDGYGLKIFPN